jgi:hypothetical protein
VFRHRARGPALLVRTQAMTIRRIPRARCSIRCCFVAALISAGCGETDARPPQWAFIAPAIIAPNCATASCHSRGAAEAGLDLSEPDVAYRSLFLQTAQFRIPASPTIPPECKLDKGAMVCRTGRAIVVPCHPDHSRLVNMLRGRGAQRMPPDRPLPIGDIELIEQWILQGAKQDPSDLTPSCGGAVAPDAGPRPSVDAAQTVDARSSAVFDTGTFSIQDAPGGG